MSPGDIANAAIGRAMGLIIKNIGGARKAVEDMGVYGNPGKYSSVIGENEENSPWEPLHVEQGFAREESAVTLFFPNCYSQIWQYGSDDKGILNTFIYNLQPGRGGLSCLMMTPHHARTLAGKGWTKPMIKKFVCEFGRVPAYRHPSFHEGGGWTIRKPETVPPSGMDPVAIIPNPDLIKVLVAGGPGAFHRTRVRIGHGGCRLRDEEDKLARQLEQAGRKVQESRARIRKILTAYSFNAHLNAVNRPGSSPEPGDERRTAALIVSGEHQAPNRLHSRGVRCLRRGRDQEVGEGDH